MRVLITGGAGFIGSHLADSLLRQRHQVAVLDDLSTGSAANIQHLLAHSAFTFHRDSIFNRELLSSLIAESEIVYHLAAAVGVKRIIEAPVQTIETNVAGSELLLRLAAARSRRVVLASSSEVYGKSTHLPFREDGDLVLGATSHTRWSYACSKAIDEFLALAWHRQSRLPVTIVRLFNTVGPRQSGRQASIAADIRGRGIRLLAEKVETREQFQFALHLGYQYFQGYFFCKPQSLTMQDIPCSKLSYVQVLSIANREHYEVKELEQAILREPSLCYRLLRYLNSAAFGLFPVRSIRHALSLLGQREIRKWVSIVVAISLSGDRPCELIATALTRARACEAFAAVSGDDSSGAFMVGIMSLMDAILDCPIEVVTAQLPLTPQCKDALGGGNNSLGKLLRLAICCERGAWEEISTLTADSSLPEETVWELHRKACRWSSEILKENSRQQ